VDAVRLDSGRSVAEPWVALSLAPVFAARVTGSTYILGGLELGVPLRRTRFVVDDYGELLRVGAVAFRGFVGGELRFH
jgi:hypothetical protein